MSPKTGWIPKSRIPAAAILLLGSLIPMPLQAAGGITFELLPGSTLESCSPCDPFEFPVPLEGTFLLTAGDPARGLPAAITGIEFKDRKGATKVTGFGTYNTFDGPQPLQTMAMVINAGERRGIAVNTRVVPITSPWPAIDATLTMTESRNVFSRLNLRILAFPRATRTVPYELLDGSTLIADRSTIGKPILEVPIRGTFFLGEIEEFPGIYRLDAVDFSDGGNSPSWRVTGNGMYRRNQEGIPAQSMDLDVQVNSISTRMSSGSGPPAAAFPAVGTTLKDTRTLPTGLLGLFTLRVASRPAAFPIVNFRRGDGNADGFIDQSDATSVLAAAFGLPQWILCHEAADVDDNGAVEIIDAIDLLMYLHRGGIPPSPPGPWTCGTTATPSLGCDSYPSCN